MDASNESKRLQGAKGGKQYDDVPAVASREGVGNQGGGQISHVRVEQLPSSRAPIAVADGRGADPGAPANGTDGGLTPLAQMHALMAKAGEEPFSAEIRAALSQPLDDSLVDIKPNGLIFVSHPHYRDRLDAAFGIGGWALIPLKNPWMQEGKMHYHGFLKAHSRYIADAVGEMQKIESDPNSSFGNCVEGAKSDCLVRCCKALPMFRECWDTTYCNYWKSQYAEEYPNPKRPGYTLWKRNDVGVRGFDRKPGRASVGEYSRASRLIDEQQAHLEAIAREDRLLLSSKDEYEDRQEYADDGRE